MPKGTQPSVTKGASGSRGRSKRKQRLSNRPAATLTSKQRVVPPKDVSTTPIPSRPAPSHQQIAPQPYILSDLKRIGIIAGAMLLILIILYLLL